MDSIDITEEESNTQKTLLRKIDLKIVPLVTFLYMISYLDRISIGNTKLEHLESDLGLTDNQYNWALFSFFFGYILFEVPSNLILYKVQQRLSIWISAILLACGIVMILMIFVKNFLTIMVARFLLGVFEAGLIPGMIYYITIWYKRSEQNYRVGAILSGPTFAGALSGLLSYAIISLLDSKAGLGGWQWIFLACGIVTIIFSIIAYFLIFDSVENVKWLDKEERKRVSTGVKRDELQYTEEISKDLKVCVSMFIFCGISVATYSFSFFIPSIINGFGFNEVLSQLLVVPPFMLGCISEIGVAFLSNRVNLRGPFVILFATIGIFGYAIVGTIQSNAIR
ncbi:4099_t:CDS:2 [Dentiscutata heterogama]|uniref:4099_t:CDS:1 n=1 Tax=Dentiscutata heterogama TaxID=1316150 RepID=A0ACA9M9C8_9GLOM|nr:4099_t:CDS:2 [Dentiscutata heterogama]